MNPESESFKTRSFLNSITFFERASNTELSAFFGLTVVSPFTTPADKQLTATNTGIRNPLILNA
jgi:hypothetical protein